MNKKDEKLIKLLLIVAFLLSIIWVVVGIKLIL